MTSEIIDLKSKAVEHLLNINVNDEYGTPFILYQKACLKYQIKPLIDVCASKVNHVCNYYFDKTDDFLILDDDRFCSDCFANFPYSQQQEMIQHAYQLFIKYNNNWLILAYSKTDTKWWHDFIEDKAEVHFIKGRIKFLDETGKIPVMINCTNCDWKIKKTVNDFSSCPKCFMPTKERENVAPYPSCWIIYRKKYTSRLRKLIDKFFLLFKPFKILHGIEQKTA